MRRPRGADKRKALKHESAARFTTSMIVNLPKFRHRSSIELDGEDLLALVRDRGTLLGKAKRWDAEARALTCFWVVTSRRPTRLPNDMPIDECVCA